MTDLDARPERQRGAGERAGGHNERVNPERFAVTCGEVNDERVDAERQNKHQ